MVHLHGHGAVELVGQQPHLPVGIRQQQHAPPAVGHDRLAGGEKRHAPGADGHPARPRQPPPTRAQADQLPGSVHGHRQPLAVEGQAPASEPVLGLDLDPGADREHAGLVAALRADPHEATAVRVGPHVFRLAHVCSVTLWGGVAIGVGPAVVGPVGFGVWPGVAVAVGPGVRRHVERAVGPGVRSSVEASVRRDVRATVGRPPVLLGSGAGGLVSAATAGGEQQAGEGQRGRTIGASTQPHSHC